MTTPPELAEWQSARTQGLKERLGDNRVRGPVNSHATVFPTFSYLPGTFSTVRVWQPRGPGEMEVYAWILVDKSMPPEVREAQRKHTIHGFSPSGMWEQDDGENWGQIQQVLGGAVGRRYAFNYQMGLGHTGPSDMYPGQMSYVMSEGAARGFYRRYSQLMESATWPTDPPQSHEVPIRRS